MVELFMVFKYNENNNVEFVGGQAMLLNIYNYFRIEMNSGTILGYFLQALPIACIVGIAFFAIRFAFLKKRKLQIKWKLEILQVIFACYLAGLISLVVLPANFGNEFVKMIFASFLNSNIYPLKNLPTSRVCIFLETPYSKASSHFPIASH